MATINGTNGPDLLTDVPGQGNTFEGLFGDDTIEALDGDDALYGASGNDLLGGGDGQDLLRGGAGQRHHVGRARG